MNYMLWVIAVFQVVQTSYVSIQTPTDQVTEILVLKPFQIVVLTIEAQQCEFSQDQIEILINEVVQNNLVCESQTWKLFNYGIKDANVSLFAGNLSINVNARINSPSRAQYGTPMQFVVVLSEQLLSTYLMPFNMPLLQDIIMNRIDTNIPIDYKKEPFDQTFWKVYRDTDVTTLALPWLPFFSQCQNYGQNIYIYDLLELSTNCTLVDPLDVIVVQTIPTGGISTVADKCNLNIQCFYAENMSSEYGGSKWWQSQGDTLFYIRNKPMDIQSFLNVKEDSQSSSLTNMVNDQSDDLIPVIINTEGVFANQIPNVYELIIKYNQVTPTQKRIVTAVINSVQYMQKQNGSNPYTLIVNYEAMGYLELVNAFQFGTPIYISIFVVLGFIFVFGIFLMWLLNKIFSNVDHPPKLRFYQTIMVVFVPAIIGSLSASGLIILLMIILNNIQSLFDGIFFMYDSQDISQALVNQYNKGRTGLMLIISGVVLIKIGTALMIDRPSDEELEQLKADAEKRKENQLEDISQNDELNSEQIPERQSVKRKAIQSDFYYSAPIKNTELSQKKKSLFIKTQYAQTPDNEVKDKNEPELINLIGNLDEIIKVNPIAEQHQGKEKKKEDPEDEEDISQQLLFKDYHYQTILLFTAIFLLFLLGFSYMKIFYKNIFYFLIVLQFVDNGFAWILSKYLLTESLLIQPILASMDIFYFVMFMAAESFQDFIFSYIARMCLIIFFRTYITPVLKNLEFYFRKVVTWASRKYPNILPYVQNYLVSQLQDQKIQFYMNRFYIFYSISQQDDMTEFKEEQSTEHVITMALAFSSKLHAIFLKPFVFVIIKIFDRQTQIPKLYDINYSDFDYYIYFAFIFIIPQVIIDIFVLNSLELIYGYKLYDYFHYCKYRQETGQQKKNFTLDQSIGLEHRSIDRIKFTDKFYFNGTIIIYGIIASVIGTTIIIQNDYRVFEDPIISIHLIFICSLIYISKNIITYLWSKFDPQKVKTYKQRHNLDSLDEFLSPVKENLEQIMEVDLIRKTFINLNKEWIYNNLPLFIKSDNFLENDEYLLKLYEKILNDVKRDEIEAKRLQLLQKKQKNLKNYKNISQSIKSKNYKSFNDAVKGDDLTDEDETKALDNGPQQIIIKITKSQCDATQKILQLWLYKGRQNQYLKSLLSDIIESKLEEHCKICDIDIELRVVEQISFAKMCNIFKFKCLGEPFNRLAWRLFYEKNQRFITLCLECEINYHTRIKEKENSKQNHDNNYLTQRQTLKPNKDNSSTQRIAKITVINWLMIARSNILFSKTKP